MANYRIVCTNQLPANSPPKHAHIVAVGIGDEPTKYKQKLSLNEVLTMMQNGHRFYTQGANSGKVAWVERYACASCNQWHIRSAADAVTDNNLDSLATCQ